MTVPDSLFMNSGTTVRYATNLEMRLRNESKERIEQDSGTSVEGQRR